MVLGITSAQNVNNPAPGPFARIVVWLDNTIPTRRARPEPRKVGLAQSSLAGRAVVRGRLLLCGL